jgi:hypothetical protein
METNVIGIFRQKIQFLNESKVVVTEAHLNELENLLILADKYFTTYHITKGKICWHEVRDNSAKYETTAEYNERMFRELKK